MDDLLDMIATDESPSSISDKIKDLLYAKSAERIEGIRPQIGNSMFNAAEEPGEEQVSDDQLETSDGV
tara:strand:- start:1069 stop:1272 length:204 start_codon:yes stop_codon:yes gene_type:complete